MQLPNIAQQQRLGMPGAPNGLGAGQASGRPPLTPAQQQTALLQLQQRAQHLQASNIIHLRRGKRNYGNLS